jgi:transcriptional regulator
LSVYLPPWFAAHDNDAIARLVREYPFATLITATGGEAQISHLPLLHHAEPAPHGTLIGHMARANPHWRELAERPSIAVFQGPHAYVSPSWYTQPAAMVPTWNYAVVHVHGTVELVDDRAATLATVEELTRRFESGRAAPWRLQLEGARLDAMLGAIVAFRMAITRVDAKFKLSQNRGAADRDGVIAGLLADHHPDAAATAEWMGRYASKAGAGG